MQPIEKTWLRGVDLNPARWCSPFGFTLVRRPESISPPLPMASRRGYVRSDGSRLSPTC